MSGDTKLLPNSSSASNIWQPNRQDDSSPEINIGRDCYFPRFVRKWMVTEYVIELPLSGSRNAIKLRQLVYWKKQQALWAPARQLPVGSAVAYRLMRRPRSRCQPGMHRRARDCPPPKKSSGPEFRATYWGIITKCDFFEKFGDTLHI